MYTKSFFKAFIDKAATDTLEYSKEDMHTSVQITRDMEDSYLVFDNDLNHLTRVSESMLSEILKDKLSSADITALVEHIKAAPVDTTINLTAGARSVVKTASLSKEPWKIVSYNGQEYIVSNYDTEDLDEIKKLSKKTADAKVKIITKNYTIMLKVKDLGEAAKIITLLDTMESPKADMGTIYNNMLDGYIACDVEGPADDIELIDQIITEAKDQGVKLTKHAIQIVAKDPNTYLIGVRLPELTQELRDKLVKPFDLNVSVSGIQEVFVEDDILNFRVQDFDDTTALKQVEQYLQRFGVSDFEVAGPSIYNKGDFYSQKNFKELDVYTFDVQLSDKSTDMLLELESKPQTFKKLQWFVSEDGKTVQFFVSAKNVEQAKEILAKTIAPWVKDVKIAMHGGSDVVFSGTPDSVKLLENAANAEGVDVRTEGNKVTLVDAALISVKKIMDAVLRFLQGEQGVSIEEALEYVNKNLSLDSELPPETDKPDQTKDKNKQNTQDSPSAEELAKHYNPEVNETVPKFSIPYKLQIKNEDTKTIVSDWLNRQGISITIDDTGIILDSPMTKSEMQDLFSKMSEDLSSLLGVTTDNVTDKVKVIQACDQCVNQFEYGESCEKFWDSEPKELILVFLDDSGKAVTDKYFLNPDFDFLQSYGLKKNMPYKIIDPIQAKYIKAKVVYTDESTGVAVPATDVGVTDETKAPSEVTDATGKKLKKQEITDA